MFGFLLCSPLHHDGGIVGAQKTNQMNELVPFQKVQPQGSNASATE